MIKRKIVELHQRSDKRYSIPKFKIKLAEDGIKVGTGRVTRLLNEMQLPRMSTLKPPKPPKREFDESSELKKHLASRFLCIRTQPKVGQRHYLHLGRKPLVLSLYHYGFVRPKNHWLESSPKHAKGTRHRHIYGYI